MKQLHYRYEQQNALSRNRARVEQPVRIAYPMVSRVIVYGAHGKVGQHLLKQIARSDIAATAVVRNEAQAQRITEICASSQVSTVYADLALVLVAELQAQIKGQDAVVVTAGSGGKDLLRVDLDGVVKILDAAVRAGVRRLVLVSAVFANDRGFISSAGRKIGLENYYLAKYYADRILVQEFGSKLDYTILMPSLLTDGPGTGKIQLLSPGESSGLVEREDVARVILEVLGRRETFGQSYNFAGGATAISQVQWKA